MIFLPRILLRENDWSLAQHGRAALVAALVALGLAFIAAPVQAAIRYVTTDGVNSGDCSLPSNACATLTYAISQASSGDDIKVASGTYTEAEISANKAVTIT